MRDMPSTSSPNEDSWKLGKIPKLGRIMTASAGILGVVLLATKRPSPKIEEFNHEDHDEIDELIEDLDNLTAFCIGFLHDGAHGGEPQGRVKMEDGLEEEKILYVEGSIQLKLVYEDDEIILIRASYTNDPDGPVIYLPPPAFIKTKPDDARSVNS